LLDLSKFKEAFLKNQKSGNCTVPLSFSSPYADSSLIRGFLYSILEPVLIQVLRFGLYNCNICFYWVLVML